MIDDSLKNVVAEVSPSSAESWLKAFDSLQNVYCLCSAERGSAFGASQKLTEGFW